MEMLKIVILIFINLIVFTNSESLHFKHLDVTNDSHQIMIEDKCAPAKECRPGLLLPVWEPKVFLHQLFK